MLSDRSVSLDSFARLVLIITQFFPSIDPFSGSRLRAQPLADAVGNTFTTFFTSQPIDDPDEYDELIADVWVSTVYLNAATGTNFTSWPEFFGPHPYNGDNFTTVVRTNDCSTRTC